MEIYDRTEITVKFPVEFMVIHGEAKITIKIDGKFMGRQNFHHIFLQCEGPQERTDVPKNILLP